MLAGFVRPREAADIRPQWWRRSKAKWWLLWSIRFIF